MLVMENQLKLKMLLLKYVKLLDLVLQNLEK